MLLAVSYLAQTRKGYEEYFWFALGHLAEAEDELTRDFGELGRLVRRHRKELEVYPRYSVPFGDLVLQVAIAGGYDVSVLCRDSAALGDAVEGNA